MLRLEIQALEERLPIVAAETEKGAAAAATGAQEARTRWREERETLPGKVAEARRHAEAAHAGEQAASSRRRGGYRQ